MKKVFYIFGQLSDSDIEWLIKNGGKEKVKKNEILISRGEAIDFLYIVLEGRFAVLTGATAQRRIAVLESGEIIGEMSFVDSFPPVATVQAERASTVYAIRREALKQHLEQDSGFAARFYYALSLFLADRVRHNIALLGYGSDEDVAGGTFPDADEVDPLILDNVSLAGNRFKRMLSRMLRSRGR